MSPSQSIGVEDIMPYRFFVQLTEMVAAAATTMLVAAATELTNGMTLSTPIWDKADMRLICLAGATGGAFTYLYISAYFPDHNHSTTPKEHVKRLAAKFLSSWIFGMMFTPLVIRWWHIPADPDIVLGLSGAVALSATAIIHKALPQVTAWALAKLPKAPHDPEEDNEDEESTHHQ